jgi:hypothetical protein
MRRLLVLGLALVALLGLVITGVATAASTSASTSASNKTSTSKTYTVTRTVGPYNGAAKIGESGSVPDGEGVTVACNNPRESIISGSAKINRKTSHGTASKDVLALDPVGAFWDTEVDMLKWGTFVNATGRKGWNSVTLTVTCRRS